MSKEETILSIIKDNVINDYYTAGIKTEVVIDTLITPMITELIGSQIKTDGKLHLITKEFPMLKNRVLEKETKKQTENKKKETLYSNRKADFLLHDNNTLYFVELKTSKESEKKEQERAYYNYIEKMSEHPLLILEEFMALFNCYSATNIGDEVFRGKRKSFLKISENNTDYKFPDDEWYQSIRETMFDLVSRVIQKDKVFITMLQEEAIKYLKNKKAGSSQKYLTQAVQIMKYMKDNYNWRHRNVRLIYMLPFKGSEEKITQNDSVNISFFYFDKIKTQIQFNKKEKSEYYDWVRENVLQPMFF